MDENKKLNFSLSFMETKALLEELEFSMGFRNRNTRNAKGVYEKISTQLEGVPVIIKTDTKI